MTDHTLDDDVVDDEESHAAELLRAFENALGFDDDEPDAGAGSEKDASDDPDDLFGAFADAGE